MKHFSKPFKFFNLFLACLQNMTLGGIIYGWTSISGSMLVSHRDAGGAELSSDFVHTMFVVATSLSFLGPLILGSVLDHFGPRISSLISIAIILSGCILFGYSDKEEFPYFLPAICLIAFGGPGVQSSIIHLSNLFPSWKATATALLTGSFQLSFFILFLFDQLWSVEKLTYQTLFLGYCGVCVFNALVSLIMWPDVPYSYEEQVAISVEDAEEDDLDQFELKVGAIRLPSVFIHHEDMKQSKALLNSRLKNIIDYPSDRSLTSLVTGYNLKEAPWKDQLQSREFLTLVCFFMISSFAVNFYIGSFDVQLGDLHSFTIEEKQTFGRLFTLTITCGVFLLPVIGGIMDRYGFSIAAAFTISCGVCWSFLLLFESKMTLLASFVFYSMFRTSLFTFVFAYLADTLGFKYFGVLGGVMFVSAGILSFLQVPLANAINGTCHLHTVTEAVMSAAGKHHGKTIDISPPISTITEVTCTHGYWWYWNIFVFIVIIGTYYFAYQDYQLRAQKSVAKENLRRHTLTETIPLRSDSYGTI